MLKKYKKCSSQEEAMAQSGSSRGQRVQVRVIDVATGEEQVSGELTVLPGHCSWGCCCCNWPVVTPPPRVNNLPQARE
jgi:hypothetical protein